METSTKTQDLKSRALTLVGQNGPSLAFSLASSRPNEDIKPFVINILQLESNLSLELFRKLHANCPNVVPIKEKNKSFWKCMSHSRGGKDVLSAPIE